jgi:hypothetical protein
MPADLQAIAGEVFATIRTGRQVSPFTSRPDGLTLDDAYRVSALVDRRPAARGEKRLGRKIGFTNRTIWEQYNVYAPIWATSTIAPYTTSALRHRCRSLILRSRASSLRSCSALPPPPLRKWMRASCRHASTRSHTDSRSCSRSFRTGGSPLPIRPLRTACTARC